MPHPRRPGSTSRRRVAGQRNRTGTGAQHSGSRIGLNRPEDETGTEPSASEVGGSSAADADREGAAGQDGAGDRAADRDVAAQQEPAADHGTTDVPDEAVGRDAGAEQASRSAQASASGRDGGSAGSEQSPAEQDAAEQDAAEQGSANRGSDVVTAKPTTAESATAESATPESTTAKPTTAESTAAESTAADDDAATDVDRPGADAAEQRFHAVADLPQDENSTTEPATAPAPAGAAEPTGEDGTDTAQQGGERRGSTGLVAVLLAAAVVLAGLASWFGVEAYGAFHGNRALADQATTSEVNGQITDGVEKIFSYDFADTGKTERAAKDLLVGRAIGEYEQLFTTVKQQAPIQKLVVTTTVKASSVNRLEGDRAEVLLFVDQNATRTDIGGEPSVGPAQVVISAERHGDQWKIANISQH